MKKKIRNTILFCLISLFVFGQNDPDITFKQTNRDKIRIPFEFVSNLIIIPIKLNNSDTLRLVYDTGLRNIILTELEHIGTVPLNYTKKIQIMGYGTGENIEALLSEKNFIKGPNFYGINQKVIVLLENSFQLSAKIGKRVHGLIGGNVFADYIVKIDYDKKVLELIKHNYFYQKKRFQNLHKQKISVVNNKPYANLHTTFGDTTIMLNYLIDTGASDALWVIDQSHEQIKFDYPYIETYLGRGLNGDIYGKKSRVKKICIASFCLKMPTTSFPDSTAIPNEGTQRHNGLVGGEVLKRLLIYIDYKNEIMFVKKGKHFKNKFHYNMSGIHVSAPFVGLPVYEITDITPNSPAQKVGLKKGDQLVEINGIKAFDYTLNEIMLLWQRKEGTRINLVISRNGQNFSYKFKLTEEL